MKSKLIFLFICIIIFSCQKEMHLIKEPCVTLEAITDTITKVLVYEKKDWPEGYGMATKVNKISWFKSSGILYSSKKYFGYFLKSYDARNIFAESISITNVNFALGCYDIVSTDYNNPNLIYSDYCTHDDDVIIDEYKLDTTAINKIELVRIDTINRVIEGNFAISFVYANKRPKGNPFEPDKIRFFNGYFKGVYYE